MSKPELRTLFQIAYDLRLSVDGLQSLADAGKIPFLEVGGRRLFSENAVRRSLLDLAERGGPYPPERS